MMDLLILWWLIMAAMCPALSHCAEYKPGESNNMFIPAYPVSLKTTRAFDVFMELVEQHQMNITIILWTSEVWKDADNLKEMVSLAFTFPQNTANINESQMILSEAENFLSVAATDKLSAAASTITFPEPTNSSSEPEIKRIVNNEIGFETGRAHKLVYTLTRDGKQQKFEPKEPNVIKQHTFINNGNNDSYITKIFSGNIDGRVIQQFNMTEDEVNHVYKHAMMFPFMYEAQVVPRMLVALMDARFPLYNWQATDTDVSEDFLEALKLISVKVLDVTYSVFAIVP